MNVKLFTAAVVLVSAALSAARAELRIWTDQNGKTIEAEHVRTLSGQVVLRLTDGSEIRVSLDALSDLDRKYAVLQSPPKLTIQVSADADRSNTSIGRRKQIQQEEVSAEVTVSKSGSSSYEASLRAEVALIGRPEQNGGYIILDRKSAAFSFTDTDEFSFQSGVVSLSQKEARTERGVEYNGYVAAVYDEADKLLEVKCSRLEFEKNAEVILAGKTGTVFDDDFEVSGQVKNMSRVNRADKNRPDRRF